MTSAYPDIEGQLYTTGAPDATYTEAEARQRAADRREVEAAASAAGASALVDAKAYTDSKVSPLATVASVVAGDLQSLADAKTYTDEQVEGLGLGGGMYLDKEGNETPYVFVVSDTDPGKTTTVNGETVEVWWVQTTPPDPMQSTPIGVMQSVAGRSYTVPTDPVATYTVDGVLKPAGTYAVSTEAQTLQWVAVAKSGYGFKAGAVTSGSLVYPAKTFSSGDVLFSDSFERADGNLAGTTSDSYAGGIPTIWSDANGVTVITGGKITKHADQALAWPRLILPAPATSVAVEFVADFTGGGNFAVASLRSANGEEIRFLASKETHFTPASGSPVKVFNGPAVSNGDVIRMTIDTTTNAASVKNMTTGASGTPNTSPAFTSPIVEFRADFRNTANALREAKVFIP